MPSGSVTLNGPLLSYADVVDHVIPAVVTIYASRRRQTVPPSPSA